MAGMSICMAGMSICMVQALAGQKAVGASAGTCHTVVWTEGGEVYAFGQGDDGRLGHGDEETELVPMAVEALSGQKVVGAAAGGTHKLMWTDAGKVYTFGSGHHGQLGHGGLEDEDVPRVLEALAGQPVVGTSAGCSHTVVWIEGGEVYTSGGGRGGMLGHRHYILPALTQRYTQCLRADAL